MINKLSRILTTHQKMRIAELTVLMIVGGFIETLSVSLILPFMDMVINPDEVMSKKYIKAICDFLGVNSYRSFLMIIAISLVIIYLFKNIFLLLEYNIQYRFVYGNMLMMQKKILQNIIFRPYEYFLGISSGDIIRLISDDIPESFNALIFLLSLLTELVVSGMLILTAFLIAPAVTLTMALALAGMVILLDYFIRPILNAAGKERQTAGSGMNKWLLQSVQGIKELKVERKENYFISEYKKFGLKYVDSLRKNNMLTILPRFFIEAVCMCTVFVSIALYIYWGADIETLIPVLSAVAVAAIRLLPSISRISYAMTSVSYR